MIRYNELETLVVLYDEGLIGYVQLRHREIQHDRLQLGVNIHVDVLIQCHELELEAILYEGAQLSRILQGNRVLRYAELQSEKIQHDELHTDEEA